MQLERALSMTEIIEEQNKLLSEQQEVIMLLEKERQDLKMLLWKADLKNQRSQSILDTEVEFWKEESEKEKARAESILKELNRLEQNVKILKGNSSNMTSTLREWEDKYSTLLERLRISEQNNEVLMKKLTALETSSTAYEKELSKLETASGRGSAGQSSQTTAQDLLARIRNQ